MFAIARFSQPYSKYVLMDEIERTQVEVVPDRGGMITRWQVAGHDVLYMDAERFANPELSVRGGIPILFPICGNLPDNQYILNGQIYSLKQHGFGRDLPWQVVADSTDDRAELQLQLVSDEKTRSVYPFEFELTFTYTLKGSTLTVHQRYQNKSPVPMPFSSGFHPYFWCKDKSKLEFEIPATKYQDQKNPMILPFTGSFDFTQPEIDVAFRSLSRQVATVTDRDRNLRITLSYSEAFSTLVFWTLQGKDFYCLEPWTAPRNALNTNVHLLEVAPGEAMEMSMTLKAETLA